jgi:hypothetical protein
VELAYSSARVRFRHFEPTIFSKRRVLIASIITGSSSQHSKSITNDMSEEITSCDKALIVGTAIYYSYNLFDNFITLLIMHSEINGTHLF